MQQLKKVCHILSSLKIGGAERFVIDLCVEQNKNRCIAEILSFGSESDELVEVAKNHKIKVTHITKKWWTNNILTLKTLKEFNVLHIHSPVSLKAVLLISPFLSGQRLIYTRHGEGRYNSTVWIFVHKLIRPFINAVTFVSKNGQKVFQEDHPWPNKVHKVIENGIPLSTNIQGRLNKNKLRIGSVGRVVELKKQSHLIKAWNDLPLVIKSKIEIHIIGDGDCYENLKEQAIQCELSQNIVFHGFMNDRVNIQKLFDLLVVTSESEGLSIAILEAMAEGKPVIGSNVGGNSRLIIDDVTGFLYPFGDIVKLQNAIKKYINDESLLCTHGKQALEHVVSNFSINVTMKKYESIYNESN